MTQICTDFVNVVQMSFFLFPTTTISPPEIILCKKHLQNQGKNHSQNLGKNQSISERKPIHSRSAKLPNGRIGGPRPNATSNAMPLWNLVAAAAAAAPLRPPAATAAASLAPSHPLHCLLCAAKSIDAVVARLNRVPTWGGLPGHQWAHRVGLVWIHSH